MGVPLKLMPILVSFFVLVIGASQATSRLLHEYDEAAMVEEHEKWMATYGRVYKDDAEKAKRFQIFKKNFEYIESFNKAGTKTYSLSINRFADMTNEEFRARNGYKPFTSSKSASFRYENVTDVPSSLDWREEGAVTPVKNQGDCGCCWAFSAVAATEGVHQLKTGELISLSEQELVDCDTDENRGCEGGLMDSAFSFIIKNHGLATESHYPYLGIDGSCSANEEHPPAATIKSYEDVPENNESALLKAVANQPVSVAIDAGGQDFAFYSSGVFTGECGTHLDHGATAVGYGISEDGIKYWLVKNSWGVDWGEDGYIRMQRDIHDVQGLCGIAMNASYPIA
ncbi:senescence-specific cysteine protease SAG39-like [Coffea arabica]|uniref:Senescence-specific cysteine protease SAG39-like n=1 Tax=Coffea arabica TaxID=13443 RepID=A0ABM4UDM3_COFAR